MTFALAVMARTPSRVAALARAMLEDTLERLARLPASSRVVLVALALRRDRSGHHRKRHRGLGACGPAVSVAMTSGLPLADLGRAIVPYPTRLEVKKRLADERARRRLTPGLKRWIERLLALLRRL